MVKCRKERPGGWDLNSSNILLSNLRKPLLRRATAFNFHTVKDFYNTTPVTDDNQLSPEAILIVAIFPEFWQNAALLFKIQYVVLL